MLERKRVVIWEFAVRELTQGDWTPLDMQLGTALAGNSFITLGADEKKHIQGTIVAMSAIPNPHEVTYADHVVAIHLMDIDDEGVEFSLRYWMETTDKQTNNIIPNKYTRSTLISLGKALFDKESKGCPAPCDIIGGVVKAEVKYKESSNGNKYPRIYRFEPASTSVVLCASKLENQYSVDE